MHERLMNDCLNGAEKVAGRLVAEIECARPGGDKNTLRAVKYSAELFGNLAAKALRHSEIMSEARYLLELERGEE